MFGLSIESNFTVIDWIIIAVYLSGSIFIGLFARRFIVNMHDMVVAGRSLKPFLGIATLVGTELGLVSVVYGSQKGFTGGFSSLHLGVIGFIITLIVGTTGFILVPLRRAGVMTIPEYYEKRFGRSVRIFGGIIMLVGGLVTTGFFIKAGALFMMGLTGMTSGLHLKLFMTGMIVLVLFYTILGGMVSVVIADYVQFTVMSFGLLAICILAVKNLGWGNILATVTEIRGESGFNPFHKEGFGFIYVVYMAFVAFTSCALWQTTVIRACAAENEHAVKRMISGSAIGFMIRMTFPILFGIFALTFVSQNTALRTYFLPEGGAGSEVTMMATPVFLSQLLPTGLIGLISAGMLAAFMSTHDSYMLCWAAVFVQDIIAPCMPREELSNNKRLLLTRMFLIFEGVLILVWGLWYPIGQDLWDYLVVGGSIYFIGASAVLVMGIYWKRASKTGAVAALTTGFLSIIGLKPVQQVLKFNVRVEIIGSVLVVGAFAVMIIGSLLFPDRGKCISKIQKEK